MTGWKKITSSQIFDKEVMEYLKSHGFYTSTMNPRFLDGYPDSLETDVPVLRLDADYASDPEYILRIFINETQAHAEVQTSWRSFHDSATIVSIKDFLGLKSEDNLSILEVERVLDELTDRLL